MSIFFELNDVGDLIPVGHASSRSELNATLFWT